jgi:hypothetical protein
MQLGFLPVQQHLLLSSDFDGLGGLAWRARWGMLGYQLADIIGCWCNGVPRRNHYRTPNSTIASSVARLEEATGGSGDVCSGHLVCSFACEASGYEQSLMPLSQYAVCIRRSCMEDQDLRKFTECNMGQCRCGLLERLGGQN